MTDQSSLQPSEGEGQTRLYRPTAEGGLEVAVTLPRAQAPIGQASSR